MMRPAELNVEYCYRKYGPMVLRRCRSLLKNEDLALDAMQDTFVQLLVHRERINGIYPSSLLYRIATNISINRLRKERRFNITGDEAILKSLPGTDNVEKGTLVNDLLERVFSMEKKSTRKIAEMFYISRMTYSEISKETGLSVSGVRKRLERLKWRAGTLKESPVME